MDEFNLSNLIMTSQHEQKIIDVLEEEIGKLSSDLREWATFEIQKGFDQYERLADLGLSKTLDDIEQEKSFQQKYEDAIDLVTLLISRELNFNVYLDWAGRQSFIADKPGINAGLVESIADYKTTIAVLEKLRLDVTAQLNTVSNRVKTAEAFKARCNEIPAVKFSQLHFMRVYAALKNCTVEKLHQPHDVEKPIIRYLKAVLTPFEELNPFFGTHRDTLRTRTIDIIKGESGQNTNPLGFKRKSLTLILTEKLFPVSAYGAD